MSTDWTPATIEHTFSTGRTATLRAKLPVQVLVRQALSDGDEDIIASLAALGEEGKIKDPAAAMRLQDGIVLAMFVRPRVVASGMPTDPVAEPPTISLDDLEDGELSEVVGLALGGVAEAERFRGDSPGDVDRADGEGVADKPKRAGGASKRKRAGASA